MSSVTYGNEGIPSNDETINPTGTILQHPYAYAAVAAAVTSASNPTNVGQYQHYYGHPLPPQQLLHVQQTSGFYPTSTTGLNPHTHHIDFNNSSPSVASSSSSIESSRKTTQRKRNVPATEKLSGTNLPTKPNTKRKVVLKKIEISILKLFDFLF